MSSRNIIICDIDGTVALRTSTRAPYDWDRVGEDEPNVPVIRLLHAMRGQWDSTVVFFSGRMEQCRAETVQWLFDHLGGWTTRCQLFMRDDDDFRADDIVKHEMFQTSRIKPEDVLFVLDDRDRVVDMWRNRLGLTVFQVAEGNF